MQVQKAITIAALLFAAASSFDAHAHGRHWGGSGFSFSFGVPLGYPPLYYRPYLYPPMYYYPPAYPYYPPVYTAPPLPPTYVEPRPTPDANAQNWYYCGSTDRYYPEVENCAEGWQSVSPYPPGEAPGYWYLCDDPAGYYPYISQCYRPWRRMTP